MIGLKIGFTVSELECIRSMPLLLATAPTSFLKELLSRWIQWPTLTHPTRPTLRVLCTSLRSPLVGLGSLADEVEREMTKDITGPSPPSLPSSSLPPPHPSPSLRSSSVGLGRLAEREMTQAVTGKGSSQRKWNKAA